MGLFDRLLGKKREKDFDKAIEKAKDLIAEKEYAAARRLLGQIEEEYPEYDEIGLIAAKAYPMPIRELADADAMEKEALRRMEAFLLHHRLLEHRTSREGRREAARTHLARCIRLDGQGRPTAEVIGDSLNARNLKTDFEAWWGAKVFYMFPLESVTYLLAIEPDRSLWRTDYAMAM